MDGRVNRGHGVSLSGVAPCPGSAGGIAGLGRMEERKTRNDDNGTWRVGGRGSE